MSQPRLITMPAPLKGNEWRDAFQGDDTASILVNADVTRGDIRSRPGWKRPSSANLRSAGFGSVGGGRFHHVRVAGLPERLLEVGAYDESQLLCHVMDEGGVLLSTETLLACDPLPQNDYRFSFITTTLPSSTKFPFYAVLIVCEEGVYTYDVASQTVADANYDLVADGGNCIRLNVGNINYCLRVPPCYIARWHNGRVYYAGFKAGAGATLTDVIEESQAAIGEDVISKGRGELLLGPQHFVRSDLYDPLSVQVASFVRTPDSEAVTALWSFNGRLLIFTERSIHAYADTTGQLQTIYHGAGCVAHNALTEVDGLLYFMARDGIYRMADGLPERISDPIDSMFTGRRGATATPEAFSARLTAIGWPFRVRPDLRHVNAVHVRSRREIWWSVPVQSRHPDARVTIVYHYGTGGWHLWAAVDHGGTNGERATCCIDAIETPSAIVGNSHATTYGEVRVLGGLYDASGTAEAAGVPFVWVSCRVPKAGISIEQNRPIRLRLLATGGGDGFAPVYAVTGENSPYDFDDTVRQEQSGELETMPTAYAAINEWNAQSWGNFNWMGKDWYVQKVACKITSKSFRFGVTEGDGGSDADQLFVLHSWAYEGITGDTQ